jgi:hypothetical protein
MKECRACHKAIPLNAKSCPFCRNAVIEETLTCPNCGAETGLHDAVCSNCHFRFFENKEEDGKAAFENLFGHEHRERIETEIATRFQTAFLQRLEEEHAVRLHKTYLKRLGQSNFGKSVDYRMQQLAEDVMRYGNDFRRKEVKKLLAAAFEELLDFFIIRECVDLNETLFPEAILKYQGLPFTKVNLPEMVLDYLDFDREEESVFTNFVSMPPRKLKNAADAFLFPKKGEQLIFICDLSILGTCKEGFAMTTKCIYWKALMEKPQRVLYHKLEEIRREEDWITINGIFFNANKTLDLKLIRLLKRLKTLMA